MRLSTRSRYGTRAMLELALHYGQGPVLLKEIAERQEISKKYLDQIITTLRAANLVKSVRGAHGGYILAREPSSIKLSEIIQALEGPVSPVNCVDDPSLCSRSIHCVTRDVWTDIKKAIFQVLDSMTLEDLVERQTKKGEGYGI